MICTFAPEHRRPCLDAHTCSHVFAHHTQCTEEPSSACSCCSLSPLFFPLTSRLIPNTRRNLPHKMHMSPCLLLAQALFLPNHFFSATFLLQLWDGRVTPRPLWAGARAVALAGVCSFVGDRQVFAGIYIPECSQSAGIYNRGSLVLSGQRCYCHPSVCKPFQGWCGPSSPGCWTFLCSQLLSAHGVKREWARLELFSPGAPSSQWPGLRFPAF